MGSKSGDGMSRRDFLRQVAAGAAAAAAGGAAGSGPAWGADGDRAQPGPIGGGSRSAAELPEGVKAVWDLSKADQQMGPTRGRVCINGLWRWQPGREASGAVPTGAWGYLKVPGCWPGITDYMQKDCQTVYPHASWREDDLGEITAAWYERGITIPREWAGRRIALHVEYLNSYAAVYVDGTKVGELRFPWGELDLNSACRPGETHVLSMLVEAMPLKGVMLAFNDTASAREVEGSVERRGLCGDVSLIGTPAGARIGDLKVDTSVRNREVTVEAALESVVEDGVYVLHAAVTEDGRRVREFTSERFRAGDLDDGRIAFSEEWQPERLWDIHTPQHAYDLTVSLLDAGGKALDTAAPVRFGFREFWIDGRDFYLNGTRVFLSAVPLDNAQVGAALASYDAARESMERLKTYGINFVYTHNYGCEPGSHLSFTEVLRAADDVGMLVALSQPHFGHYDWQAPDADEANGYAEHAEFYVRVAQNHPSVVAYSMSHNATGYSEDMNPDMIDGVRDDRDQWSRRNAERATRAEAIVKRLDPGRIVYHHSSGNLSSMHTSNFYPNFVPTQELSDWFEHWATEGVKPVFTVEYGAPFSWDWAMYRGWYKGKRTFGSATVPWEFCHAEWNAQFLGDRAFRMTEMERANLRWEAEQFREGKLWYRWDYPHVLGSRVFDDRHAVIGMYTAENWRAYRTWGVSANSPWEHGHYWRPREGVSRERRDLKVDWDGVQRPGFSADYIDEQYERMDLAFERADWEPTADALALIRNNMPLLAYIGGKPARFTSKDHNFHPGEAVEKQLIIINNSREAVTCEWEWSFDLPEAVTESGTARVATGGQARIPIRLTLPPTLAPGTYGLTATVGFSTGESQTDAFGVHVMARQAGRPASGRIALFDPTGETAGVLAGMGVRCQPVDADADLSGYELLIIGKGALTLDGAGPDLGGVRQGLKVIVFEQTAEVLEKRLGFRVAEYGLRQVFGRVADHPVWRGIASETLRDWRGEATLLPPRLEYETDPEVFNGAPTVKWCDIDVTRVWRCGCRGNVASVLIEKPARGDFLPLADGGFGLQYSPLMECREGSGAIWFCQMDVTGRTEGDPAAEALTRNLLQYAEAWEAPAEREALYVGDPAGRRHLEAAGLALGSYEGGEPSADQVLIVGPGGGPQVASDRASIGAWLESGGRLLAVGIDEEAANAFLPLRVSMRKEEHIATWFEPAGMGSLLAGVGPADVASRDPRELSLVTGPEAVGNGVLATIAGGNVVFCQLVPWEFEPLTQMNLKRTYRRTSVLLARLLGNMGVAGTTPLLDRFHRPVSPVAGEKRWLEGLYLDEPEEWDDPYRFFRW